jgi:hypothetical protein
MDGAPPNTENGALREAVDTRCKYSSHPMDASQQQPRPLARDCRGRIRLGAFELI